MSYWNIHFLHLKKYIINTIYTKKILKMLNILMLSVLDYIYFFMHYSIFIISYFIRVVCPKRPNLIHLIFITLYTEYKQYR